jgi:HTH-type transcriptional regulator/antitoxin HigA
LDNFWFTLAHELAHIALHIDKDKSDCFIDDLETEGDHNEKEADRFAQDAMIPARIWRLKAKSLTKEQIPVLAAQLRIHPAIIAGRIRWEQQNYRIHSDLLGRGQVKKHLLQAD